MERNWSSGALPPPPPPPPTRGNETSSSFSGPGVEASSWAFGAVLSAMYVAGVTGNAYTLALLWRSGRWARGSRLSGSIASLALADLLYLCPIPFIVGTSVAQDWYFGELGCRVLLSLDLLTMHASIFTLTLMCAERYLAVARPLAVRHRRRAGSLLLLLLRRGASSAGAVWGLSLLLALPMMLMVTLSRGRDGKRLCAPTWSPAAYRLYLTVLFGTSILAPGLVIGCLYARLAAAYLAAQRDPPRKTQPRRPPPRHKVLLLLFAIVLAFWACFLPFWLWQLLPLYLGPPGLPAHTQKCINYLVTCLTYSNSCINPFLYTLLTRNYREYLRSRHSSPFGRFTSSLRKRGGNHPHCSGGRSPSSGTQVESGSGSEGLGMAELRD